MGSSFGFARPAPVVRRQPASDRADREEAPARLGWTPVTSVLAPSPTLTVGPADDPAEVRADRIADRVLRALSASAGGGAESPAGTESPVGTGGAADIGTHAPADPLRRSATPTGSTAEPVVGRAGGALDPELSSEISSRLGGGAPLPAPLRTRMEGAFGTGLGEIRLHTDDSAARLSRQVAARAFTVGRDVFFGAGEYRPDTADGQRTIAHELAHTASGDAGGDAGGDIDGVHRLWDMRQGQPLGVGQTTEITTVGNRQVWFLARGEANTDKVVVKLEDQPFGLNQLATTMHEQVTKATTVQTKQLPDAERTAVRTMIAQGRLTAGDGWLRAESNTVKKADYQGDLHAWARAVHVAAIDAHPNDPMIAMTIAKGVTAEKLLDPALAYGNTGIAPIKKVLSEPKMVRQLGELSAVDLFLGNTDRVLSGNLGNWFYTPDREMTVIDNVHDAMAANMNLQLPDTKPESDDETSRGKGVSTRTAKDPLDKLGSGQLALTAYDLVKAIDRSVRATFPAKTKQRDNVEQREWDEFINPLRAGIEASMLAGLIAGRKRLIRTLLSSRVRDRKFRGAKKAIKAEAQTAAATDNPQDDYYEILKARAKWLSKN